MKANIRFSGRYTAAQWKPIADLSRELSIDADQVLLARRSPAEPERDITLREELERAARLYLASNALFQLSGPQQRADDLSRVCATLEKIIATPAYGATIELNEIKERLLQDVKILRQVKRNRKNQNASKQPRRNYFHHLILLWRALGGDKAKAKLLHAFIQAAARPVLGSVSTPAIAEALRLAAISRQELQKEEGQKRAKEILSFLG